MRIAHKKSRIFGSLFWLAGVCVAAILIGIWLRLYQFGAVPVSLYWDEAAMLADARHVATNGRDFHGKPWNQALFLSYGDFKQPVYILAASMSIKFLGANAAALRLPSLLAGLGTIILGWFLGKALFSLDSRGTEQDTPDSLQSHAIAWFTAAVVALSPWAMHFSRTGFEAHLGQFLLGLAVLLALYAAKKPWLYLVASVIAALATYSYFSVRFVWVALALVIIASTVIVKWLTKRERPSFALLRQAGFATASLLLYAVLLMPMSRSPYYAESNQFRLSTTSILTVQDWPIVRNTYRLAAGNAVYDKLFFHPIGMQALLLATNYAKHLDFDTLFLHADDNMRHSTTQHGLLLLVFAPFFYAGLYYLVTKKQQVAIVLGVWWLLALLPASVPVDVPHALRSINGLLPLSIITAAGCWVGYDWLSRKNTLTKLLTGVVLSVVVLMSVVEYAFSYFAQYPYASASDWQYGYAQIARSAEELRAQHGVVWIENFDSQLFVWFLGHTQLEVGGVQAEIGDDRQPEKIANVYFRNYELPQAQSTHATVVLIGYEEFSTEALHKYSLSVVEKYPLEIVNKRQVFVTIASP